MTVEITLLKDVTMIVGITHHIAAVVAAVAAVEAETDITIQDDDHHLHGLDGITMIERKRL